MKSSKLVTFLTIGLIACFAATGCKKKPQRTTPLPGQAATQVGTEGTGGQPVDSGKGIGNVGDTKPAVVEPADTPKTGLDGTEASKRSIEGRPQDREKWKNQTVYFEFDRSVVRSGEAAKVDTVASEFKACNKESDLLIEGHCDERGTPEYNRALGERRAQALREYLIRAGVDANRVHTLSFGKDKPALLGHDEAAWSKNRRGEFILVLPK
jgi:peptidoglycan-associated lipoprotein